VVKSLFVLLAGAGGVPRMDYQRFSTIALPWIFRFSFLFPYYAM